MKQPSAQDVMQVILASDPRYKEPAYAFVREALDYTLREIKKQSGGAGRHVSGQELLAGIRAFALSEFGPLTATVLRRWGITRTLDFGHIVFNMVNHQVLGKSENDSLQDFADGYDFHDAFVRPFLPGSVPEAGAESPDPEQSEISGD